MAKKDTTSKDAKRSSKKAATKDSAAKATRSSSKESAATTSAAKGDKGVKKQRKADEALAAARKAVDKARDAAAKADNASKAIALELSAQIERLEERAEERRHPETAFRPAEPEDGAGAGTALTPPLPHEQSDTSAGGSAGADSGTGAADGDLEGETIVALRARARQQGMTGISRLSKSQLVDRLRSS